MNGKNKQAAQDKKETEYKFYTQNGTKRTSPPVRNVTHPLRYYELTEDEINALEECDRESFYQRCLPFSTLLAVSTYSAVKHGYLKPNLRFGAFPKVTIAVAVGYFLGKLSYQQTCAEKLMNLPGSYIGKLLRERRDGKLDGSSSLPRPSGSMLGAGPGDIYSDAGPGSALNLDTDRPTFSDDAYRPDHDATPPAVEPASPSSRSYDELRRRNRGEFTEAKQDPYRVDPGVRVAPRRAPPPPPSTNQYGDALD